MVRDLRGKGDPKDQAKVVAIFSPGISGCSISNTPIRAMRSLSSGWAFSPRISTDKR